MSRRRIIIPETVEYQAPGQLRAQQHPFSAFLKSLLDTDQRFGRSRDRLKLANDIEEAFEGKEPGAAVDLREAPDWELLAAVAREPQFGQMNQVGMYAGYSPGVARAAISYVDAICEAEKVPAHPAKPRAVPGDDESPPKPRAVGDDESAAG